MSRKEWIAAMLVIGLGVIWQIPRHDEAISANAGSHTHSAAEVRRSEREEAHDPAVAAERTGPYRTIAVEVTRTT